MNTFLHTALTLPTVLWSVLLTVCAAYWALSAAGLLDGDSVDHLLGADTGTHGPDAGGPDGGAGVGLLSRVGLGGVPAGLSLTLLAFVGWVLTYFTHLLLLPLLPGPLSGLAAPVTLLVSLLLGTLVTSAFLRPARALYSRLTPPPPALIGRVGEVRSAFVDAHSGRASFEDGGAGLVLQVRTHPPDRPARGAAVVIVSFDAQSGTYLVASELAGSTHPPPAATLKS
ncbi:hypothetical protein [Deinococcus knuensis]|uniref:DUF1449 family protein n=1 Tax=Deinococcus knuensis TaxID=1837380 RepID=A0ABQ2SPB4_9DEIO|nr:hypothetical protein [Deinococcus knuensis]GGS35558.1 hypothetical protein GCM10008961_29080 [Deinococcus knuensis]